MKYAGKKKRRPQLPTRFCCHCARNSWLLYGPEAVFLAFSAPFPAEFHIPPGRNYRYLPVIPMLTDVRCGGCEAWDTYSQT